MERNVKYNILAVSLFSLALVGCTGRGVAHVIGGLIAEEILSPDLQAEDGLAGLAGTNCWDLDNDGLLSEDEDVDGDGVATAYDCRGAEGEAGSDGEDGADSTVSGPAGPQGSPGISPPIVLPPPVIIVIPPVVVPVDDEDDDPAGGHPPFGRGPDDHPDHPEHPDKPDKDHEP
jgi:hypothetical protein